MNLQNEKHKEPQTSDCTSRNSSTCRCISGKYVTIGSGRIALAVHDNDTIVSHFNNTGVNVQTDTNQKQECKTAGGASGITGSCTAASTDTVTQSGGILKK